MRSFVLVGRLAIINQLRRVGASILLVVLPLGFYFAIAGQGPDNGGNAIAALAVGLGWANGFAPLFGFKANAGVDARLAQLGSRSNTVFPGRLAAYLVLGFVVSAILALVPTWDKGTSYWVALATFTLGLIAIVPVGALIGIVVPGEIEGVLITLGLTGIPFALAFDSSAMKFFPIYSALRYAYFLGDTDTTPLVIHAVLYGAIGTVLAYAFWRRATARATALV